jgi:hypothetical protein
MCSRIQFYYKYFCNTFSIPSNKNLEPIEDEKKYYFVTNSMTIQR